MAELTQIEKIELAFKRVFGIQGLSNTDDTKGLKWYEEQYGWRPFLVNEDIFMETVPQAADPATADTNVSANPTIIEKVDIKLSLVVGTNGRGWVAYQTYNNPSSPILDDWLMPQLFGFGYALRLFQDDGTGTGLGPEITTTEGAWVPSYKLGFIVLGEGSSPSEMGWTSPLWARVYRYIGAKGVSGSTSGVSLDDAYNSGNTINADDGPVVINASNNYAGLQLTPVAYVPTTGVTAGQVINNGGVIYNYDGTRSKWLSVDQHEISFQTRIGDGNYLSTGNQGDINSGYTALRNGTILGVTAVGGSGNSTKSFSIRKAGSTADIVTFSLNGANPTIHTDDTLDLDFSSGDVLQVYCSADGAPIKSPRISLTIAWRV